MEKIYEKIDAFREQSRNGVDDEQTYRLLVLELLQTICRRLDRLEQSSRQAIIHWKE